MKSILRFLIIVGVFCAGLSTLNAAEKKVESDPRGGRILEKTSPKAEFFVEKENLRRANNRFEPRHSRQLLLEFEQMNGITRLSN
jgi:hypothetical protein